MGLFAVVPIPKGAPVWRFVTGFDQAFSPTQVAAWPETAQAHVRWFGFISRETGQIILSGDTACFMNHAADPNTGAPPDVRLPVTTVALRDIRAGEEITCDYHAFDDDAERKLGRGDGSAETNLL